MSEFLLYLILIGIAALVVVLIRVELRLARIERRIAERNQALANIANLSHARHMRAIAVQTGGRK